MARTSAKATTPSSKRRTRVTVTEDVVVAAASRSYFASSLERHGLELFSSGCVLLDQVLAGGYCLGRMSNIIGDKSTGKTLLAIEAVINFLKKWEDGYVRYAEAEAAFDKGYAAALGMPVEHVHWAELVDDKGKSDRTVEWLFEDIEATCDKLDGKPGLYIVDSLDALSDRAELSRGISEGSFALAKAKKLGELFRRLVGKMEKSRLCLIIISQIRDKIGVTFGETKMRTGGKSMDFYATHCLWLSELDKLKKTIAKIERVVGFNVRAKCKKNKIGLNYRECDFSLVFGYGIDDLTAAVEWLLDCGRADKLQSVCGISAAGYKIRLANLRSKGGQEVQTVRQQLNNLVETEWSAIEQTFLPDARKY